MTTFIHTTRGTRHRQEVPQAAQRTALTRRSHHEHRSQQIWQYGVWHSSLPLSRAFTISSLHYSYSAPALLVPRLDVFDQFSAVFSLATDRRRIARSCMLSSKLESEGWRVKIILSRRHILKLET